MRLSLAVVVAGILAFKTVLSAYPYTMQMKNLEQDTSGSENDGGRVFAGQ